MKLLGDPPPPCFSDDKVRETFSLIFRYRKIGQFLMQINGHEGSMFNQKRRKPRQYCMYNSFYFALPILHTVWRRGQWFWTQCRGRKNNSVHNKVRYIPKPFLLQSYEVVVHGTVIQFHILNSLLHCQEHRWTYKEWSHSYIESVKQFSIQVNSVFQCTCSSNINY